MVNVTAPAGKLVGESDVSTGAGPRNVPVAVPEMPELPLPVAVIVIVAGTAIDPTAGAE
jgi:hypothetical protein